MKSGRDEAARGSIPGSSPRPDREHGKPQPTTCYTVVCVKTAVEISEESQYSSLKEAEAGIAGYFAFYNDTRPHQALAYQTPGQVHFALARPMPMDIISDCEPSLRDGRALCARLPLSRQLQPQVMVQHQDRNGINGPFPVPIVV